MKFLRLNLFDERGSALELVCTDGSLSIPSNVAEILVSISQHHGVQSYHTPLMKVLEALPAKLKKITILSSSFVNCKSVREYLAFLEASVNKTECLWLSDMSQIEEFQSIASGLSQPDGLKELRLNLCVKSNPNLWETMMLQNDTLRILLWGLASSSYLERLHLTAEFNSLDDVENELISAIQGIRTLKKHTLDIRWVRMHRNNSFLQNIFRAAVLDAQVKDLNIICNHSNPDFHDEAWVETFRNRRCVLEKFRLDVRWTERNRSLLQRIFCSAILDAKVKELLLVDSSMDRSTLMIDHDVWVNTLCRRNCTLEKLHLFRIKLGHNEESSEGRTFTAPPPNTMKNTSVKDLLITSAKLKCTGAREILNRFQSLESLYLSENSIRTISLFNHDMLMGEDPTLQRLVINIVDGQEDEFKSFLSRIPDMRSLRRLRLQVRNQGSSNSCIDLLEKAVLRNTSLQQVSYSYSFTNCDDRIDKNLGVWLSRNRAGQGFLQNSSISLSLWPLILERAGKISYYYSCDAWECPCMVNTRVDAVYWLLREKFFL